MSPIVIFPERLCYKSAYELFSYSNGLEPMTLRELQKAKSLIGKRIRETRHAKGLTQVQLASLANTNQAVIQEIENGKSVQPRNIEDLAIVLDVNPACLYLAESG